jgi:hypothetical protein
MPDPVPESRKRSRSPKQIIWDDLPVEQVVRPQGKGHSRQVHQSQNLIMESYQLEPVGGKPQSYQIILPTRADPPRIVKELRRLAKKHVPKLVLFSQTDGNKVWLWTQLASEVEPRARGGRRPRPRESDNGHQSQTTVQSPASSPASSPEPETAVAP